MEGGGVCGDLGYVVGPLPSVSMDYNHGHRGLYHVKIISHNICRFSFTHTRFI